MKSTYDASGFASFQNDGRPVCYQGFPEAALPHELKNANPLGIWRMLDGQMSRDAVAAAGSKSRVTI